MIALKRLGKTLILKQEVFELYHLTSCLDSALSPLLTKLCRGCVNKFASSEIHCVGAHWLLFGCISEAIRG